MSVTIRLSVAQDRTPVHVIDRKSGRTVWNGRYNKADRPEAPLRAVIDDTGVEFGSITVVGPDGAFIGGIDERVVGNGDRVAFSNDGKTVTVETGKSGGSVTAPVKPGRKGAVAS